MFERRLRILLVFVGLGAAALVLRLAQLQLVHADYYRARASSSLILTPSQIPFVRGRILDRTGLVLVRDEACWDIAIDYEVLAVVSQDGSESGNDPRALHNLGSAAETTAEAESFLRLARRLKRAGRYPPETSDAGCVELLREELASTWAELARFSARLSPESVDELRERGAAIHGRIMHIRRAVAKRRGFDAPIAEEMETHTILGGLDADAQIDARVRFARFPWIHVRPSWHRRFSEDITPLTHVLGRIGRVTADDVREDPFGEDPFATYRANEWLGVSGVEWAAEATLRGRRGQITRDRDGHVIAAQSFPALDGDDVTLTIHAELQRRLYDLLGESVRMIPESAGGALVVLHVPSREVLALVSFPSYDANRFAEIHATLADDTERLPFWFRAVASRYPPGSTIKPLVCLAGLMNGRISTTSREHCSGRLFDDVADRWRCWQVDGTSIRKAHGDVDVVEALTGSCNVFMYRLGEALGVDSLCSAFDMAGIGRASGLGLREEVVGINPTPSWLMENKNARATPGTARLFAIGQGELAMTPVQVANLLSTYASGRFRPVSLIRNVTPTPEWTLPVTSAQWQAVRRGIYGVVNDPNGTAYKYARFDHPRWALCGKTGSATAHPWPTAYRIPFADENGESHEAIVRAGSQSSAMERFRRDHPAVTFDPGAVVVAARWPDTPSQHGEEHSHAWFGGFLQPRDSSGMVDWSRPAPIAFAVLVEFGGSGGRTSGPLARDVAATLVDVFGADLNVDAGGVAWGISREVDR
jgi:cell division protein FtsI/penicillin-binding protein 2